MNAPTFYNHYHKKNSAYTKIIKRQNFTYFYILQVLHRADLKSAISGTVLDIGCGVGTLALYLSQFAAYVFGIDISTRAIKIAQFAAKANCKTNTHFLVKTMSAQKNKYDLIIATEIIEHIQDDNKLLKESYSSLKPGGYLLLTTPSRSSLMFKWGWYQNFDHEVGHLRRYTKPELKRLLIASGFKIISIEEKESILRSVLFTTPMGKLIRFIRGPFVNIFHFCDEQIGRIFGFTDIIVLAKK